MNQSGLESFICPISQQIMRDPVMTKYGHCFEREAITEWVRKQGKCPLTQKPLSLSDIFPAYSVKSAIEEYM